MFDIDIQSNVIILHIHIVYVKKFATQYSNLLEMYTYLQCMYHMHIYIRRNLCGLGDVHLSVQQMHFKCLLTHF